uniref:Uncharacterized protein n=1 Tax=Globisporangium ultimum (strain ATCC 200006 / CBS 805.95 / DAOM BR144) TaxID=431595 RepID=K3WVU1_GLOUD
MLVTNRGRTSPIVRHGTRFTYSKVQTLSPSLRVQSSVKTQLGRKQASTAESKDAFASSVDRQGHWAIKSRVGAYAKHSIPFDCDLDQNQADIIYHVLC